MRFHAESPGVDVRVTRNAVTFDAFVYAPDPNPRLIEGALGAPNLAESFTAALRGEFKLPANPLPEGEGRVRGIKLTHWFANSLALQRPNDLRRPGDPLQDRPAMVRRSHAVQLQFLGANPSPRAVGEDEQPGYFNYLKGGYDGLVARISPDGSRLLWCSYLGGTNPDGLIGVEVDPSGVTTVAGYSDSDDSTTPGAFQPVCLGGRIGLIARIAGDSVDYHEVAGLSTDVKGLFVDGDETTTYSGIVCDNSPAVPLGQRNCLRIRLSGCLVGATV